MHTQCEKRIENHKKIFVILLGSFHDFILGQFESDQILVMKMAWKEILDMKNVLTMCWSRGFCLNFVGMFSVSLSFYHASKMKKYNNKELKCLHIIHQCGIWNTFISIRKGNTWKVLR